MAGHTVFGPGGVSGIPPAPPVVGVEPMPPAPPVLSSGAGTVALAAGAPPVDPEEGSVIPWDALGVVEGVLTVGVGVDAGGVVFMPSVVVAVPVAVLDAVVTGALVVLALVVIESVGSGCDITVVDVSAVVAPALVAAGSAFSLPQPSSVPARAVTNTGNTRKGRRHESPAAGRVDDDCGAKHGRA